MSHLSRFDLSFDKSDKPLPALPASLSQEESLEQLTQEICQFDPELAEILFSAAFSTKSRDERVEKIRDWAGV